MAGAELDSLLGDLEQRVSLAEAEETVTSSFQETRSFITCTTTTTQQLQQPRSPPSQHKQPGSTPNTALAPCLAPLFVNQLKLSSQRSTKHYIRRLEV